MLTEHIFATGAQAATDIAARIATLLSDAIAARGVATLAVSGGRSPRPVLEALSKVPLDWTKLIVTLVDERWVDPVSADSNERLVRETLLQGPAAAARFVPMKNSAADAYAGQSAVEADFTALPWPFDIILLGMGVERNDLDNAVHRRGIAPACMEDDVGYACIALPPVFGDGHCD